MRIKWFDRSRCVVTSRVARCNTILCTKTQNCALILCACSRVFEHKLERVCQGLFCARARLIAQTIKTKTDCREHADGEDTANRRGHMQHAPVAAALPGCVVKTRARGPTSPSWERR